MDRCLTFPTVVAEGWARLHLAAAMGGGAWEFKPLALLTLNLHPPHPRASFALQLFTLFVPQIPFLDNFRGAYSQASHPFSFVFSTCVLLPKRRPKQLTLKREHSGQGLPDPKIETQRLICIAVLQEKQV